MTPDRLSLLSGLLEEYRQEYLAPDPTLDVAAFTWTQLIIAMTERAEREELARAKGWIK